MTTPQARPWIVLQHGNDQDPTGYQPLVDALVEQGFVVFGPDHGNIISNIDEARSEQVLCTLRWIREQYSERSRLGDCYGLIGHSNGASGTFRAAMVETGLDQRTVAAVVGLAPRAPLPDLVMIAEQSFPYLAVEGTRDEQTLGGAADSYEQIGREREHTIATGASGFEAGQFGDKALVRVYGSNHSEWGGLAGGAPTPKGTAILEAYVSPFIAWQFFGDATWRSRFSDNTIPSGLDTPSWWNTLDQYDGTPLILTAFQAGNRRQTGVQRLAIATYEQSFEGEGVGGTPSPLLESAEGNQQVLVQSLDPGLTATDRNRALLVGWDEPEGLTGNVTWSFPTPDFNPTHVSFRVLNVFSGWSVPASCTPDPNEEPASIDVLLSDGTNEAGVRVDNIISQEYAAIGPTCFGEQVLTTVRIPVSCFEHGQTGTSPNTENLESIQFRFGEDPNSEAGRVLIDSVEFTTSDDDQGPVTVPCPNFPASPVPASYLCEDYDPAAHVDFTVDPGSAPGDPEGVITMDASFARYVAGRPEMVTGCDGARYELDTVSADEDSDGTADQTYDVRSLEGVQASDLVAQLGLEEGDAAITINEPGKPDTNGIELYDYASFVAAHRRFGALQNLEVRLLREQTGGLHQPILLDSQLPPAISGIEPPQAPAGPSTYTLPSGATTVSNTADLVAELALPNAHDIIVSDGDYTWTGPVTVAGPHRVWSENLLGATLRFGLTYAGNPDRTDGLELHGLDFQLDDASMAPAGVGSTHVVYTWGQGGEDVLIEDCAFDGDLVIGDAVGAYAPNGLIVRRSTISNFWGYGIFAKQGGVGTVLASEPLFEDLQIQSIFGATPGSSGGAQENGILLGNNGTIQRVDIRDVGWSAIQLYNDATGVSISDVFVDYAGPGVWDTAYSSARGAGLWLGQSHDVTIERVRIEPHVFLGINVHWDTGNPDPFLNTTPPRNYNITISDLYSRAYKIGVHFDLGVEDAVVRSSRFEHAWMAGVLDNNRFEDDWNWHPCPGGEPICLESPNRTESIDCYLQDDADCIAHHHNGGATSPPPTGWPAHPDDYVHPGGLLNRDNAALPGPGSGGGGTGQADSSTSG